MWYIHSTVGQPMVFKKFRDESANSKATTSVQATDRTGRPVEVSVGGGAYVLSREGGRTRKVVITQVTDEELEILHSSDAYMRMKERGFFTERHVGHAELDASGNPSDMQKHDNTAQISDEDHAKGTDERLNHASTCAYTGINNQYAGRQPLSADEGSYGDIRM